MYFLNSMVFMRNFMNEKHEVRVQNSQSHTNQKQEIILS